METRIQPLHDGFFVVEKVFCVLLQRMSRCLYTGENFKQNVGKNQWKIGDLIYDHELPIKRFDANLSFG